MNLLDQIDDRLKDTDFSLNRDVFEECSTSLLSAVYPNLVPITGGSDNGRDAEIDDPGGTIAVLVTSARDIDGALANLRSGCRQMLKKKVEARRVILANLAVFNASKRTRLHEAAKELGFKVVAIYPRPWYANQLLRNPDWRIKILQLPGGIYTLAKPPTWDLAVSAAETVGRTDETTALRNTTGDVIVQGEPGVGKTHLVAQLPHALFVEKLEDLSNLSDHLIETRPRVVVLDDAGARPQTLNDLKAIRRNQSLKYRIVAVCWPHDTARISDLLADATHLTIGLMTKPELGQILRERGTTHDALLFRILDQARGRPGWAVRLGDLLNEGTQWSDVMRGHIVRNEVGRYLRTARISNHAYQTLATIALIGGITDTEFDALADLQGTSVLDLHDAITKVAESGLFDVEQSQSPSGDRVVTYTVQPDLLAASLAADTYFSERAAPHPLARLRDTFPRRQFHITTTAITAELVGASHPGRPTPEQVIACLDGSWNDKQDELLRRYAALSTTESTFVLALTLRVLEELIELASKSDQVSSSLRGRISNRAEFFAENAADLVERANADESYDALTRAYHPLVTNGHGTDDLLDHYFEHLRGGQYGEPAQHGSLTRLAHTVATSPTRTDEERHLFIALCSRLLTPAWEANHPVPDQPRSFRLRSNVLTPDSMRTIASPLIDTLETLATTLQASEVTELIATLDAWVDISNGYGKHPGLNITPDLSPTARDIARRLANVLSTTNLTKANRRRLNGISAPLKLHWPEPDELFNALTPLNDLADEDELDEIDDEHPGRSRYVRRHYAALKRERDRINEAAANYLNQDPAVLCSRLEELQPELAAAGLSAGDKMNTLFEQIAATTADPIVWIRATHAHNLSHRADAILQRAINEDAIPADLLEELLKVERTRATLIWLAPEYGAGANLERILQDATPADLTRNTWGTFLRASPEALKLYAAHPDPQVAALAITNWAAWLEYVDRKDTDDTLRIDAQQAAIPTWTNVLAKLDFTDRLDDHTLERALVAMGRRTPDTLSTMFERRVNTNKYEYRSFESWAPSIQALSREQRTDLWKKLNNHRHRREAFWTIAGTDTDWIGQRLNDGTIPEPSALLGRHGYSQAQRPPLEQIAALFGPLVEPEHILGSMTDTMSGERVGVAQHRLEESQQLACSSNSVVAKIGAIGVETYTAELADAKKAAREAELRGEIWY